MCADKHRTESGRFCVALRATSVKGWTHARGSHFLLHILSPAPPRNKPAAQLVETCGLGMCLFGRGEIRVYGQDADQEALFFRFVGGRHRRNILSRLRCFELCVCMIVL